MNDAERYREWFSRACDGDLSPSEQAEFEAFLQRSPTDRVLWGQFRATVGACHRLPRARLSSAGRVRLARQLEAEARARVRRRALNRWTGMATAATVLLTVGYAVGVRQQAEPSGPGVVQALPAPQPTLRLRDGRTGGWLDVSAAAAALRSGERMTVEPRIRVPYERVREQVRAEQQRLIAGLGSHGVGAAQIEFRQPVTLDESLLDGPALEFWVERPTASAVVPVGAGAP